MPASQAVGGNLHLVGPVSYTIGSAVGTGDPTVRLSFTRIANQSATNPAGPVAIRFIATTNPLTPLGVQSPFSYYSMSAFPFNLPLGAGAVQDGFEFTYYFTPPPDGTYYVSVLLLEYEPATCANPDRYCVDDYQTAPERVQFIGGVAHDAGPAIGNATGNAVEYYWAARDHYFWTASPAEIGALDTLNGGWQRTGYTWGVYDAPVAGSVPVCRFYIPPIYGDSHVYTFGATLCAQAAAAFPVFDYETPNATNVLPSDPVTGACPAGSTPLYKLYNGRPDTNHRYTILPAIRNQMLAKGYVLEGNGNPAVAACAPL
jgi:hypothetical protein